MVVIGAGPIGLRTAIESQLMGARVVVMEKRKSFTRYLSLVNRYMITWMLHQIFMYSDKGMLAAG